MRPARFSARATRRNRARLGAVLLCACMASPLAAEEPAPLPETLTIATRHAPPFAIRAADGRWSGIAIELWERIAEPLGVESRYVELPLTGLLDAVVDGRADVAVAALTITAEREQRLDFSHPFLTTGLGIAVQRHPTGGATALLRRLVSAELLGVLAALLGLLTVTGTLIWLAERRHNDQFRRDPAAGIGSGIWWSAVTMTTVGYGDKAPTTLAGRLIALVWMFAGIIMISGFTAAITTALTVGELERSISGVDDLYGARVLSVAGSTSARFLDDRGIRSVAVADVPEALDRLAAGDAEAVVHDAPILRWHIAEQHQGALRMLPTSLQRQDYGIALPQQSPAREPINALLLQTIRADDWQPLLNRYLGAVD
jgi:polar amino acid transport system substrate-binding protein